jgi:tetratricopeptide (TPR) repeat protein
MEACGREAADLERRSTLVPAPRSEALRSAARGLRLAAALLSEVAGPGSGGGPGVSEGEPGAASPLGAAGLRGALAAGHLAIARGRPGDAELIGGGIEEAAPRHPAGPRLVGQALFAQDRFRPAARAYRAALARNPEDGLSRALHAEALWFAGEWEGALCALRRLRQGGGPAADLAAALEEAMRGGAVPRERAGR